MLLYYHQRGMKIRKIFKGISIHYFVGLTKILKSKIEFVVEYNRDRPLKDFVETMTRNRMQATKDGIDALSQLYKVGFKYKSDFFIIFSVGR